MINNIKEKIKSEFKIIKDNFIFKIITLIIIILLTLLTSFNAGRKFYFLTNTFSQNKKASVKAQIAKWSFKSRLRINNEVFDFNEKMY